MARNEQPYFAICMFDKCQNAVNGGLLFLSYYWEIRVKTLFNVNILPKCKLTSGVKMSLFRKPTKKIQRRVFCADDDEDGAEDPQPLAPPPPVISKKKDKPAKTPTLLSFADEGNKTCR